MSQFVPLMPFRSVLGKVGKVEMDFSSTREGKHSRVSVRYSR